MGKPKPAVRWAPRVPREKIRRLYVAHALGIFDDGLTDEVGRAMLARCESILTVTEAADGRVRCPGCGALIRHQGDPDDVLACGRCSWRTTWDEYRSSYRAKQLHGGSALPAFSRFVERWPRARGRRDKMLLIDALIHACHGSVQFPFTRPAAVNLIEGRARQVVRFLDELAYGDPTDAEMKQTYDAWKQAIEASKEAWSKRGPPE